MTHPQTAALKELLERVEAGAYERPDGDTKRYSAFYDDFMAADVCEAIPISKLMDAFHNGDTSAIRALIADTEGR